MTSQDNSGDATVASTGAFSDFDLAPDLLATLGREGLVTPTPIQSMSLPILLKGRDLVGLAQTGTGKTAAFLLPMLTLLGNTPAVRAGQPPKALILAPTRELANQITSNVSRLGRDLNIRHIAVFGGARYDGQIKALKRGVDIVIATPGRLMDLMDRGAFDPRGIQFLVLDEADHMLDLGFFEPIKQIVSELPDDRQTMLFSATMPPQIEQLGKQFLSNPERVKAPQTGITADKIAQRVTMMPEGEKRDQLCDVLNHEDTGQCLIFVRTKRRADQVAKFMQTRGFAVDALHGDMRQGLRQKVLRNFRDGQLQALIATDVAARGIDIAGLSHVVNFDITDTPEAYVHRIGRTGRAGLGGLAISFCSPSEEARLGAIISVVGARCELFDLEGNPVTDFKAKPEPRKRNRPTRNRRDAGPRQGERSNGGNRDRKPGDRKSGDKPRGDRKFGDKPRGDKKFGDKPRGDKKFGDKKFGDKKFGDKKFGDRKFDDKPRRNQSDSNENAGGGDRSAKRKWGGDNANKGGNGGTGGKWSPVEARHDDRRDDRRDDKPNRASRPANGGGKKFGDKNFAKGSSSKNPFSKSPFSKNPFSKGDSDRAPSGKPASNSGGKPFGKSGGKPGGKPFGKSGGKPGGKPFGKPGGKSGGKPFGKPGGNERMKRREG